MGKSILMILVVAVLLVGCANQQETNSTEEPTTTESTTTVESSTPAEEPAATEEPTEPPHEHAYTETTTKEVTCTEAGEKLFSCECGDTYTEPISATGHVFESYVFNNDASYTADGTETATCVCGLTDTRTAEGSKLEYTYTDLSQTMYAKSSVNVRSLPSTEGEKLGSLSINQEVAVTGQCNETSWYKFDYNGQTAFVSNNYLSTEKVEVAPPAQETTQYVNGWNDMGDWFVYIHASLEHPDLLVDGPFWEDKKAILRERYPGCNTAGPTGIKLKDGISTAWMVSVGGTHSYDYPQALLDFIKVMQYKY